MKMQALYQSTKSENTYQIAEVISRAYKCKCDQIPPAYPCENEKVVFIGVEGKGSKPTKQLVDFCKDLTPARTKNVAFFVVSSTGNEGVAALKDIVVSKGVNVMPEVFEVQVKSGLFSKGKLTDANLADAKAWADKIVAALSE